MSFDVEPVLARLRATGSDSTRVEAKASRSELPKSVGETLSSFSNDGGGMLLLGVAEREDFDAVGVLEPVRVRDALADLCSQGMEPPVRAEIEIVVVEGVDLVVAVVPELAPNQKPCYVKNAGIYLGSYTRAGDGDRHLTQYEVGLLLAGRGQPQEDLEPVPDAGLEDLDATAVERLLTRVRQRQPRAFADVPDEVALSRLRVLVRHQGALVPSLAGLLSLGVYPQQFFPQLNLTFVSVPGTSMQDAPVDGPRFLDNQAINGSIPVIVEAALNVLVRNMAAAAVIDGAERRDVYDYPVEALREAVTNALMHRDYSAGSRGAQVQIEMFADRLVVRSPGGLFGGVTEEELGAEGLSSSRNGHLASLLAEVSLPGGNGMVAEGRGSGIPRMLATLRRAGMTLPIFKSRIASFTVSFPKHSLLDPATLEWLGGLGSLSDAQRLALALMREGRTVTNASLRQLGFDSREATAALSGLVSAGHARASGGRRYAQYTLTVPSSSADGHDRTAQARSLFASGATLTAKQVGAALGVSHRAAINYLNLLIQAGEVEATAPARSPGRRYRAVGETSQR